MHSQLLRKIPKVRLWLAAVLSLLILLPANGLALVAYDKMYVEDDAGISTTAIPKSYLLAAAQTIFSKDALTLNAPCDLFVSPDDYVFVADKVNNRIIKLNNDLEFEKMFDNSGHGGFKEPESVFVDEYGGIYVADTGNSRIVKLDSEGRFVEEFGTPHSALLGDNFVFNVRKVSVSNVGYIYALKYQYVMQMDAYNNFRGYIGATEVGRDLWYTVRYLFSNAEQRKVMLKREPASCYSFAVGEDGSLYVTTADRSGGELKRINSVGVNIYPKKTPFGLNVANDSNAIIAPQYVDVAVDKNENVVLLESVLGKISIYNNQGENLCVFGGKGSTRETFLNPVAVDIDSQQNIFVLDQKDGSVKKFAPTRFMRTVYTALSLYDAGQYQAAENYWEEILSRHESYSLANAGMASLKFKQKDYAAAMDYYYAANDREGYTKAFTKNEMVVFREKFTFILLTACAVLAVVAVIGRFYQKFVQKKMDRYSNLI